jgi:hypothetical protein
MWMGLIHFVYSSISSGMGLIHVVHYLDGKSIVWTYWKHYLVIGYLVMCLPFHPLLYLDAQDSKWLSISSWVGLIHVT